jgi:hypothetical protein
LSLPERRFPSPWTAEETDACFIVRDKNGQALAYVYFEEEPGRRTFSNVQRHQAEVVTGVVDISDAHQFDNGVMGADRCFDEPSQ